MKWCLWIGSEIMLYVRLTAKQYNQHFGFTNGWLWNAGMEDQNVFAAIITEFVWLEKKSQYRGGWDC